MRYSDSQVLTVGEELKKRYVVGTIETHELVVTLMTMVQTDRISSVGMREILLTVFHGNASGVLRALESSSALISKELMDAIISDINV
jgi:hypothetical protein